MTVQKRTWVKFSEDELKFIEDNYLIHNDAWLADKLGRNKYVVRNRRQFMLLYRYSHMPKPKKGIQPGEGNIEEEIEALILFIESDYSETLKQIAKTRLKIILL